MNCTTIWRRNTQQNYYQNNCHSRKSLSGICDARSFHKILGQILHNNGCVEDPRLQASGMTPLLNKLSRHALTYKGVLPRPLRERVPAG